MTVWFASRVQPSAPSAAPQDSTGWQWLIGALLCAACDDDPGVTRTRTDMPDAQVAASPDAALGDAGGITDGGLPSNSWRPPPDSPLPCNTLPGLCALRYDQVLFPGTHASMAFQAPLFAVPTQSRSIRRQLDDGVRALHFELHLGDGGLLACREDCALGESPWASSLEELRAFLELNPREVVTLWLEHYVPSVRISDALRDAGLLAYAYPQVRGEPWPTLEEMIRLGKRLVVLVRERGGEATEQGDAGESLADGGVPSDAGLLQDAGGGALDPRLLMLDALAWETHAEATAAEQLDCLRERGAADAPLVLVHHYLTTADTETAALVNDPVFLTNRLRSCETQHVRMPNLIFVDHYDIGQVLEAVQQLQALDGR
jgi:hypothetical protein